MYLPSPGKSNRRSLCLSVEAPKTAAMCTHGSEEDEETQTLLQSQGDRLPRKCKKPRRKVQWLDKNGHKLAEILEFQPRYLVDSADEDSNSCICKIM